MSEVRHNHLAVLENNTSQWRTSQLALREFLNEVDIMEEKQRTFSFVQGSSWCFSFSNIAQGAPCGLVLTCLATVALESHSPRF